ncbi:MAG: hypothetical protein OXG35_06990, partial [Acidobacteria bacterium]|nr:hypothetical protein [Acidobacteriota bacterium]
AELTGNARDAARRLSAVGLMANSRTGLALELVEAGERAAVTVRRYRRTGDVTTLSAAGPTLTADLLARARTAASRTGDADLSIDAVIEAAAAVDPTVLEALLVETGTMFDLDGRTLIRLDDGGVPGDIIDMLVALSFPDDFEVRRSATGGGGGGGFLGSWGSYGYDAWYPYYAAPFGYYYGWSPYRSLYGWGDYYYVDRGYYGYGPGSFITDAPDVSEGRVYEGYGYTRVARPQDDGGGRRARPRATSGGGTFGGGGGSGRRGRAPRAATRDERRRNLRRRRRLERRELVGQRLERGRDRQLGRLHVVGRLVRPHRLASPIVRARQSSPREFRASETPDAITTEVAPRPPPPAAQPTLQGPAPLWRRPLVLIPLLLDAVAPLGVAVQRRHEPEQTAVRAVPETVAAHPDGVARQHVVGLDAVAAEPHGGGGLHGPQGGSGAAPFAGDLEEDPGVRVDQVHFPDRPLEVGEVGELVVAVGMMRPAREGDGGRAEEPQEAAP